jgi:hypothetical protein
MEESLVWYEWEGILILPSPNLVLCMIPSLLEVWQCGGNLSNRPSKNIQEISRATTENGNTNVVEQTNSIDLSDLPHKKASYLLIPYWLRICAAKNSALFFLSLLRRNRT